MEKNIFPEKPTSQFTNEQISQRNEILSEEVRHITFDDIKLQITKLKIQYIKTK